jgi:uncharacterized protein
MPEQFPIDIEGQRITATVFPAQEPLRLTLVLGPGSDGSQHNPFVATYASELARRGVLVLTYDFPYAARGVSKPDSNHVLKASCRAAIVAARECRPKNRLFAGGKSLGARISTQVLAEGGDDVAPVLGLVALGFPLHPVGHPEKRRDAHLGRLEVPMLFVQGTRDALGTAHDLRPTVDAMSRGSDLIAVAGGDHSFLVGRHDHPPQADVHASIQDAIVQWMRGIAESGGPAPRPRPRRVASHLRDQLRSLHRRTT